MPIADFEAGTKICPRCSTPKPLDAFGHDRNTRDNKRAYCKECSKAYYKPYLEQWKYANRELALDNARRYTLKRKYGLDVTQYDEMLKRCGGVCEICGKPETRRGNRLAVDHCHKTGVVRGLLCTLCNTAIGKLGDDPSLLRTAASYLERKPPGAVQ